VLGDLIAAFERLRGIDGVRVVVLRGSGDKAFVAGADIQEMSRLDVDSARPFIDRLRRACEAARQFPCPVIARIPGWALGGGLELAAACDLRIASDRARFGMPEVKVGIPSVIEAALLPQLIGWGRTRRLLYTGEIIGSEEAERWGLVERVVPAGSLDQAVEDWVSAILAAGPRAIRLQKALIRDWEELTVSGAIGRGIEAFTDAYETAEPSERMVRFLARRKSSSP
jgi:enoyl-CoA hydratase/carnithine racemase